MAKVNEFETAEYKYTSSYKKRFSDEARIHYRYSSAAELIEQLDNLSEMIKHHKEHQRPRLKTLRNYYEADNETILRNNRRREEHLADHRAIHAFGEYVSNFMQGYMVGIPLKTTYPDEKTDETLRDINRTNDADEHNSDLVLDQSIYGRAYELLYRNKNDETRFAISDVLETFVIYDDTVEMNKIAGVRYIDNKFKEETTVYLYTAEKIFTFDMGDDYKLVLVDEKPNPFEDVPIIEYENNKSRMGDFERVLNLIDLYDEGQSDTSNYMSDFNDAMLKIVGNLDIDAEEAKKMKANNILMLQTEPDAEGRHSQADADYIYKKYDVQGTEAYKDRVKNDIHMFTHTPNTDDENFAGNQSGEALKYKLFGLELKRSTKERLFKKSLRDRYRLINNIMKLASEGEFDVNKITITFTPNLPKSLKDEIKAFTDLGGELSDETKLSLLSFVENPKEELEKIKKENALNRQNYEFPEEVTEDE
ncbi:MAG TPA: phage portal protein [Georgenia sp.]|nr:phage portal protein [Georgenia sp.]